MAAANPLMFVPISLIAVFFWTRTYRGYRNQDARSAFERTPSTVSQVRCVDKQIEHRRGLDSHVIDGCNSTDAAALIPVRKMWPDPPATGTAAHGSLDGVDGGLPFRDLPGDG